MGDRQRNPGSLQEKVWADSVTEKPKAELLQDGNTDQGKGLIIIAGYTIVKDITNFCFRLLQEPYTAAPARLKTKFLMSLTMKVFDFHSMDGHAARPTAG